MKKLLLITAIFAFFFSIKIEANTPAPVEFGIFYSSLSPHGSWIELEPGFVVWQPTMVRRWSPYSDGRWVWTSQGWYWDSYEPFGHITYHYGRWYFDDYYGWIWVPDYEWGPAWVEWRYDDNYIGWAPLPPYATFTIGIGIVFTNTYYTPYNHWHYVGYNNFCDPYPYNYYVAEKHKYRIHSKTKYRSEYDYRNGSAYNRGVDYDLVRKRSGRDISQRDLIRTSDYNDLRNNGGRNDGSIRTFAPSKSDLRKEGSDFRSTKKADRNSSLLTSKVEIGDRKNRTNDRVTQKNDMNKSSSEIRSKDLSTRNNQSDVRTKNSDQRNESDVRTKDNNTRNKQTDVKTNGGNRPELRTKGNESSVNQNRDKNTVGTRTQKKSETNLNRQQDTKIQNNTRKDTRTEVNRQPALDTRKSGSGIKNESMRNQKPDVQREVRKSAPSQTEVKRNTQRQTEVKRNTERQREVKSNNERQTRQDNPSKKRR